MVHKRISPLVIKMHYFSFATKETKSAATSRSKKSKTEND